MESCLADGQALSYEQLMAAAPSPGLWPVLTQKSSRQGAWRLIAGLMVLRQNKDFLVLGVQGTCRLPIIPIYGVRYKAIRRYPSGEALPLDEAEAARLLG